MKLLIRLLFSLLLLAACDKHPLVTNQYYTQKVVLVSIDGARWSETWGDSLRQFIPYRNTQLLPQGLLLSASYNNGYTYTTSGHTAMLTGIYQEIENSGKERPVMPNIFQYYRWAANMPASKAWVISSKDKIEALANCNNSQWMNNYLPMTDCGVNGLGTGYREDSITYRRATEIFKEYQPNLALVHFRDPDYTAHQGDWTAYLTAVKTSDSLVGALWAFLQADSNYHGVTTMIITNDHGRHLDGVADGFVSHGDGCAGCRHVELMILGPDVDHNQEINARCELIDVPSTIAELLHVPFFMGKGKAVSVLEGK